MSLEERIAVIAGEIVIISTAIAAIWARIKYWDRWKDNRARRRATTHALTEAAPALLKLADVINGMPADPLAGRPHPVPPLGERLNFLEHSARKRGEDIDVIKKQITTRNGGSHLRDAIIDTQRACEAATLDIRALRKEVADFRTDYDQAIAQSAAIFETAERNRQAAMEGRLHDLEPLPTTTTNP